EPHPTKGIVERRIENDAPKHAATDGLFGKEGDQVAEHNGKQKQTYACYAQDQKPKGGVGGDGIEPRTRRYPAEQKDDADASSERAERQTNAAQDAYGIVSESSPDDGVGKAHAIADDREFGTT